MSLHGAGVLAVEQGAVGAQAVGQGRVDQVARIRCAHLEEDAVIELAHGGAIQGALQGDGRVGPDNGVDADGRAFGEQFGELLVGLRCRSLFAAAEIEIIFLMTQQTIALQAE